MASPSEGVRLSLPVVDIAAPPGDDPSHPEPMDDELGPLILNETPDAVILSHLDGTVVHWSPGARAMFGYAREEAKGRTLDDLIVPRNRIGEATRLAGHMPTTGTRTYETLRRRKDGTLLYVTISTKLVDSPAHDTQYVLSSLKDVTDLRISRDAKMVDTRFGHLLELVPDAIVMADPSGRVVYANSQAEGLFGYDRGTLFGQSIETLLPERYRAAHVGHRAEYGAQPRVRTMGAGLELHGRRRDGSEFPVEISLSPLEIGDGPLVMSAIRDITERRRVERTLQEKNAELEAANQELEAFSYSISHDLRAPLQAMIGFSRLLRREHGAHLPAEAGQQLERIHRNAMRMEQLLDGLLTFSRLSRQPLKRVDVEPSQIVRHVLEELSPGMQERRVDIEVGELPRCHADPTLLYQVFVNLLSNAIKYTRDRDPAVVSIGSEDRDGERVYFVRDNGAGFDMRYAGRLFGVFQRLPGADEFEGTGVGLAIVQRIIARHRGRIWAEGAPGRGATFSFTLGRERVP